MPVACRSVMETGPFGFPQPRIVCDEVPQYGGSRPPYAYAGPPPPPSVACRSVMETGPFGLPQPRVVCEDVPQYGTRPGYSYGQGAVATPQPPPSKYYGYKVADSPIDYVTTEKIQPYAPAWTYDTQYPPTVAEQRGEEMITYQANPNGSSPEMSGAGPNLESSPEDMDMVQPPSPMSKKKLMGAAAAAALLVAFFMRSG